eukprot:1162054-Pelagomonas_calceolata.AAC.4
MQFLSPWLSLLQQWSPRGPTLMTCEKLVSVIATVPEQASISSEVTSAGFEGSTDTEAPVLESLHDGDRGRAVIYRKHVLMERSPNVDRHVIANEKSLPQSTIGARINPKFCLAVKCYGPMAFFKPVDGPDKPPLPQACVRSTNCGKGGLKAWARSPPAMTKVIPPALYHKSDVRCLLQTNSEARSFGVMIMCEKAIANAWILPESERT